VLQPSGQAALRRSFPATDTSASAARAYIRDLLLLLDGKVDQDAAVLLLNELVTNAILHAGSDSFEVVVRIEREELLVSVHDAESNPPVLRPLDSASTGGLGLVLVDRLAQQWGFCLESRGGKAVWFRLAIGR
jgi:two-component sensor histidine kinase